MAIIGTFKFVFPILTIMFLFFTIYAASQMQHKILRNIFLLLSLLSLIGSIAMQVIKTDEESTKLEGIKKTYQLDESLHAQITGKFTNVSDYNKLKVTVLENGKLAGDNVITTVYPSQDRLRVSYSTDKNGKSELRILVNDSGQKLTQIVEIKKAKDKQPIEISETSAEDASIVIQGDASKVLRESDVSLFTQEAKETTKRFNKEVREDSLLKIEIKPNDGLMLATLQDKVKGLGQENKEVIADELSKRIIALYRSTILRNISSTNDELPIRVVYQNGSTFGESTKEDPQTIKLVEEE